MFRKIQSAAFLLFAFFAACLIAATPSPAAGQSEDPPEDSLCRTCHEDQYYLYDTGKWYCLCGKQRACVDCHGGDPGTSDVDKAHEGIIVNPIADNPAVCQDCHPDDYEAQIVKFAAVAGIDPSAGPRPTSTPLPIAVVAVGGNKILSSPLNQDAETLWYYGLLGILFLAFLGVILFGYRCWRADCLQKKL